MKILIITSNIGRTAPGIVFERLIYGLSKMHTLNVITAKNECVMDLSEIDITCIARKKMFSRLRKILFSIFGINFNDLIWANKIIDLQKKKKVNYDLIFSFVSYNHFGPMMAGRKLASFFKQRHFVYAVDAIPPPIEWLQNDLLYRKTKKMASKYLRDVDGFFSANEKMLKFQMSLFDWNKTVKLDVIYNPSSGLSKHYSYENESINFFLYTGAIYGNRKPDCILGAFKKILADYPNSVLEFVGTKIPEVALSSFTNEERRKIVIHNFTSDLEPFYMRATALIDIDSDLPNDIYLSSKITNYILINRPIICQTGDNSPSSHLFKKIPSILQCGHNIDDLADAMRNSINQKGCFDFKDRDEVISLFNLENIVKKINENIIA